MVLVSILTTAHSSRRSCRC